MVLASRARIALLFVLLAQLCGCGGGGASPSAKQNVATVSSVASADRLEKAMQIASLHLKYKEYDQAEQSLQAALSDPAVKSTTEAMTLLDKIKAAKLADATSAGTASSSPAPSLDVPATGNVPSVEGTPSPAAIASEDPAGSSSASAPNGQLSTPSESPAAIPNQSIEKPAEVLIVEDKGVQRSTTDKVAATEAMIAKLESRLKEESEAAEALKVYERFVERHSMSAEQEQKFADRVAKWKEAIGKKLVRWGNQWITPEAAAQKKAESVNLLAQADAMMRQRNFKEAATLLNRASNFDPNSIRADFTLGLMYSGVGANQPTEADEHFRKVLLRTPGHISALNNLALIEIKMERFPQALNRFTQAAELTPRTPEVTHNVGRVIKEAGLKKLDVPASVLSKFIKLYTDLTQIGQAPPSNPSVGWMNMPMYLPERERPPGAASEAPSADQLVLFGSGSGFVVSPGYVLTNRSVVRDEELGMVEAIRVRDPADPTQLRELPATVVAISADHDLALVKCGQVQSAALRLSSVVPPSGAEILTLGFPTSAFMNRKLRDVRAAITGSPEESNGHHLIFEAELNGISGGPVLSQSGEAVGLISSRYKIKGSRKSVAVIPSMIAASFVKVALPNFASDAGLPAETDWPDVTARATPSTVALLCYHRSIPVGTNPEQRQKGTNGRSLALEDTLCSKCNGSSLVPCPNKGCIKGSVSRKETYSEVIGTVQKRTINKTRFVSEECPVCDGRARVDCRACDRGRDPSLRGR